MGLSGRWMAMMRAESRYKMAWNAGNIDAESRVGSAKVTAPGHLLPQRPTSPSNNPDEHPFTSQDTRPISRELYHPTSTDS